MVVGSAGLTMNGPWRNTVFWAPYMSENNVGIGKACLNCEHKFKIYNVYNFASNVCQN